MAQLFFVKIECQRADKLQEGECGHPLFKKTLIHGDFMKKPIFLFIFIALCLSLSACSSGKDSPSSGTPGNGNTNPPEPEEPPGTPKNLMATSGDRQVTLSWTAPSTEASAITHYEYQQSPTSGTFDENTWTKVSGDGSARQVVVPGLTEATTYFFRVRAVNTKGTGTASEEIEAIAYDGPTAEPGAPTNLMATSGDRQVTLGWEASSIGASVILRYEYQYSTTSGTFDENTWTHIPGVGSTVTVSGLTEATTYFFRVRAVNTQGPGTPSTEMGAIAYDGSTPEPGAPPTLAATPGNRQVTLGWEASSLGASAITHYEYQSRITGVPFDENTWTRVSGDGSVRQVVVPSLTGGDNYFFRVRAVNAQGAGAPSTEIDATPYDESAPEPGAPGNLRAIPGDRQVTLNWEAPSWIGDSAITSYEYQYRTTSGTFDNTWIEVPNWESALEITISSLTGATRYFFRVRAVNTQGKGSPTQVSVTPYDGATAEPGAPTNLMATSGDRQVTLGWDASSLGASAITSYEYQYSTTSGTFGNTWTEVPNWESALEITIPNLIGTTTYTFRVRAVNTQGPGVPSTEVEAIAYDGPTPEPGAPPNLTPTSGDRQVTLNWEASSLGASEILRYEYQYSTTRGAFDENTWAEVPNWESALEITIPNLTGATTYYFRVRAVNAQGTGAPSTEMEAIAYDGPTPEPGKPKNLIAIFGDRQVRLSWEASSMGASAITRYEYQYGMVSGTFSQTWTEVPDWESALEVTIDGLIGGTTYHFQVRAVNAQGEGIPSDASQTPYDRLTNPEAVCSDPATTGDALPGMGTVDDPFVLCSPVHLNLIGDTETHAAYTLSASYVMGQDIDLNNESFTPIAGVFTGTLDGRDKKIMNLTINVSADGALFVELGVGGNIKNLGIENFDVTGSRQVGSLVATSSGTITNCYAVDSDDSTDVSGGVKPGFVGGLVGKLSSGSITSSYATGSPNGGEGVDNAGGLVGYQFGGSIISSYATGNPEGGEGSDSVGGLVGHQDGGSIISSYATGNPEGGSHSGTIHSDTIGGLVGYQNGGSIISSYATGNPEGGISGDDIGGLVGKSSGSIISSYATGSPNGGEGNDYVGGLVGHQDGGSIISSYATGDLNGGTHKDNVGGLVGKSSGSIISSYATGSPNGGSHTDNVGGLVGIQYGGSIISSYATGDPNGGVGHDYVGGLVGYQNGGSITSSYGFGTTVNGEISNTHGAPPSDVTSANALTAGQLW